MTTTPPGQSTWPRARTVAASLREQFTALGISPDQARQIVPSTDVLGREYVRLGTLSLAAAELLLRALPEPAPTS